MMKERSPRGTVFYTRNYTGSNENPVRSPEPGKPCPEPEDPLICATQIGSAWGCERPDPGMRSRPAWGLALPHQVSQHGTEGSTGCGSVQ